MAITSFPFTSKRGKAVQRDVWSFDITAATTVANLPIDDTSALTSFGAITQAAIDNQCAVSHRDGAGVSGRIPGHGKRS